MKCVSGFFAKIRFGRKFSLSSKSNGNVNKASEISSKKRYTYKDIFRYADRKEKCVFILGTIFTILSGGRLAISFYINKEMLSLTTEWSKKYLNNMSHVPSNDTLYMEVYPYAIYSIARGFIFTLTTFLGVMTWDLAAISLQQKIKREFLKKILYQELNWIAENKNQLLRKLTHEINTMQNAFNSLPMFMLDNIACWICTMCLISYYSPWLAIIFTILEFACVFINYLLTDARQLYNKKAKANGYELAQVVNEVFTNLSTVISFGGEKNEFGRFYDLEQTENDLSYSKALCTSILTSFLNTTKMAQFSISLYITTIMYVRQELPFVLISTITIQLIYVLRTKACVPMLESVKRGISAGYAILEVIDTPIKMEHDEGVTLSDFRGDIVIENLDFRYPKSSKKIFQNFNLTVEAGEVVAFVGKSGSGKSTIFNLLTRFYDPTSGKIKLDGVPINTINKSWLRENVGIVSQEPILFDATIEENIKFGRSGATFEEVEKAAGLANATEFIRNLPKGYDTNALELSGGQKQRVAIARALIRNPKVLLLDEATSALDSESEKLVKDALNLAFKGRTVLIVAHKLSTIVHADRIYVLSEGKIVQSGSYDKLLALSGEFNELFNATADEEEMDKRAIHAMRTTCLKRLSCKPQDSLIDSSVNSLNRSNWGLIIVLILAVFATLLYPLDILCFSYERGRLFEMFHAPVDYFIDQTRGAIQIVVSLLVINSVFLILIIMVYSWVTEKLTSRVALRAFWSSLGSDVTNFKSTEAINTIISCPPKIREAMEWNICSELSILTTTVVITFMLSWRMALLLILLVLSVQICFPLKEITLKHFTVKNCKNQDNFALESIQKVKTVQLMSLQEYMIEKYTTFPRDRLKRKWVEIVFYALETTLGTLVAGLSTSLIFLIGSYCFEKGLITLTAIQSTHFMTTIVCAHSMLLTAQLRFVRSGINATKNLLKRAKLDSKRKPLSTLMEHPSIEGSIEFQNVSFAYKTNPNHRILKNVNLHILPGQTVGIVGKSGSGKSTLISLIEKFIEPTSGQILIDGVNIADYRTDHLRSRIGIVSQEPVLFNCSIRENIAYGVASHVKVASDEDIYSAAKAVGVHQFIMNLPMGYDTPAGECGSLLSGGQKQRVAVARAFIRKPNIVILDEATSALDNRTEKSVRESLETLCLNRTTLIIAHRLSTIKNADFIIVLDDGQIVEKGTYEELIEIGGYFYHLVQKSKIQ